MTIELACLLATATLAASLWIPFIVGVNMSPAKSTDFTRPLDPSLHAAWVHRAYRAHLNLLEQLMPFAVIVLVAHLLGVSNTLTVWASVAFLVLRLVHAAGMITGTLGFPARPIVFTAGWVCCIAMVGAIVLG